MAIKKCVHCFGGACEIPLSQECDGRDLSCSGYKAEVLKPCQGCVYFAQCGETNRRHPCDGRKTKREAKNESI